MRTSYHLAVHTDEYPGEEEYSESAQSLVSHLESILCDSQSVEKLTKRAPLDTFHTEVEVHIEDDELVAAAVVDIDAEGRIIFDKPKFVKMIKDKYVGKNVRIEKRHVDA